MILPTKRISNDRALLAVGGEVLSLLNEPKTVSRLWEELRQARVARSTVRTVTYDWFILSLDLLYSLGAINLEEGLVRKASR